MASPEFASASNDHDGSRSMRDVTITIPLPGNPHRAYLGVLPLHFD
jgi:hypothetical protein